MKSADITVIGAGAIGAASAWKLAQTGLSVVMIGDRSAPPASDVAAGMLAPVTEAEFGEEELLRLNVASADLYPAFVEELEEVTGRSVGYRRCGTIMVARDLDDVRALEEVHAFQQRLGLTARRISGRDARDLEPALSPRTRGAIVVESDHQIDPSALLDALLRACADAGVEQIQGRVVEVAPGVVRLDDGVTISSSNVVLAAGAHSAAITGALPIPIRPVKGQLVHLRARASAPVPTRNIRGLDVYMVVRTDGRVIVGASVEEQGFDRSLTAGAVLDLLRDAYEIVPGVAEFEFLGVRAGLRPATPDNAPIVGELAPGLIVATGHYRNGILLTPITARAVVGLVRGEQVEALAPFGPHRFTSERIGS